MTSVEKQSVVGDSKSQREEIDIMTAGSSLQSEILEAIDLQLRHIASQIENTDTSGNLEDNKDVETDLETETTSEDGGKSDITLPSYTEMCADEESLIHNVERADDVETEDESASSFSVSMPGCFGDCGKVVQRPILEHYRYIGKQRPNFEEFENSVRVVEQEAELRKPPAHCSAVDLETFVNRWLKESETDMRASNFFHDHDTRQSCQGISLRLSSSAIEISSEACKQRKRKLVDYESEEGLGSRSETDLTRPKQRVVKRRKTCCYYERKCP